MSINPNAYEHERWRNLDDKLDKVVDGLNKLITVSEKHELRLSNLENAPKEAQARWNLYLLGGGCLYMVVYLFLTVAGIGVTYLLAHP